MGVPRKVLITGVSQGLGRALALELAKRGHTVIGCARSQDKIASLQSELSSHDPSNHLLLTVDVVSTHSLFFLHLLLFSKKNDRMLVMYCSLDLNLSSLFSLFFICICGFCFSNPLSTCVESLGLSPEVVV